MQHVAVMLSRARVHTLKALPQNHMPLAGLYCREVRKPYLFPSGCHAVPATQQMGWPQQVGLGAGPTTVLQSLVVAVQVCLANAQGRAASCPVV